MGNSLAPPTIWTDLKPKELIEVLTRTKVKATAVACAMAQELKKAQTRGPAQLPAQAHVHPQARKTLVRFKFVIFSSRCGDRAYPQITGSVSPDRWISDRRIVRLLDLPIGGSAGHWNADFQIADSLDHSIGRSVYRWFAKSWDP